MRDGNTKPRFGRIPEEVLLDHELDHIEVRLYGGLVLWLFGGNVVTVSQRKLAEMLHMDRRTIRRSLANLARRGHISVAVGRLKRKTVYQLNSKVFLADAADQLGGNMRPDLGGNMRPLSRYREQGGKVVALRPGPKVG